MAAEEKGAGPAQAGPVGGDADASEVNGRADDSAAGAGREPSFGRLGALALDYAGRGWHVFPIRAKTKDRPLVKWGHEATDDAAVIRRWWSRWPNANIGVACGPSGLCVLDLDQKNGKDGRAQLDALELLHGALPRTLTARTPTGGTHLYLDGEAASTADKLARGVDTRSSGGYVVAPGSETAAGAYSWLDKAPVAAAPPWVAALAGAPGREREARADAPPAGFDNEADLVWARGMLAATEALPEGAGSDDQAYRLACLLRDRGLSQGAAEDLMAHEWPHPHDPDWVRSKVSNAFSYAKGDAGRESAAADFPDDAPPQATRRPRLRPMTFGELGSLRAPRWLARGMIPAGGLAVVYGRPKAGKTFWALDLSLCVATGRSFHGVSVERGRATYVAAEGGPARLRDRVAAWLADRGASPSEIEGSWGLVPAPVDLTSPGQVAELLDGMGGPMDFVVLDTLARCMSGDENSQKDMGAAVRGCDRIRSKTGAAVLLVHHEGKDGSKGARGSTVLRGAIDTGIRGRNEGGRISFSVEDQRDGEAPPPMTFELATVPLGGIEDSSAVLRHTASGRGEDLDTLRVRDLAAGMDGGTKASLIDAVADELAINPVTARRRVEAAIPKGRIGAIEHGGGALWLEPHPTNTRGAVHVRFERPAG